MSRFGVRRRVATCPLRDMSRSSKARTCPRTPNWDNALLAANPPLRAGRDRLSSEIVGGHEFTFNRNCRVAALASTAGAHVAHSSGVAGGRISQCQQTRARGRSLHQDHPSRHRVHARSAESAGLNSRPQHTMVISMTAKLSAFFRRCKSTEGEIFRTRRRGKSLHNIEVRALRNRY